MTNVLSPEAVQEPERARMAVLAEAERLQNAASDPGVSAWVRANAGTGKTYVLVQRILRLLLNGAEPQSLLCLTYTKNAAAEMEARVLNELGSWTTARDADLDVRLEKLLGHAARVEERLRARCLFAQIIDAARGLPIMTIHSFCEQVLRRFPVEAGMPPNFEILTEDEAEAALRKATDAVLDIAAREPASPLGAALSTVIRNADAAQFDKLLGDVLAKRSTLRALLSPPAEGDAVDHVEVRLRLHFGLSLSETVEGIRQEQLRIADDLDALGEILPLLLAGKATDQKTAGRLKAVIEAKSETTRLSALSEFFLTTDGKLRKNFFTKDIAAKLGGVTRRLDELCASFASTEEKLCAARIVEASTALVRLAGEVADHYEREKRLRCAADFDDLIEKTLSLLEDGPSAEWVLFQLDHRIDHILVDEAQDTSAAQWTIIERLTGDFFSGESTRDCVATVFAVGDVKQSIYSFQGAEPRLMIEQEDAYSGHIQQADLPWRSINLGLSFRSVPAVLQSVDAVWQAVVSRGDASSGEMIRHIAHRASAPGLVEIWEPELPAERQASETWSPESEDEAETDAATRLCERIADQIAAWLEKGEMLASEGRPIKPGDILILLKKRAPLLDMFLRALKARGIPVAGADRFSLLDSIAVADLLALGDALMMPEDDLALAAALKSPLFGFDDDDLFALAYGRGASLWAALSGKAAAHVKFEHAFQRLEAWRQLSFTATPFAFYHHLLDAQDLRLAFTARLGLQCQDALNEFLQLAETFSEKRRGTFSEFLCWIRATGSDIKRGGEQKPDAVRVMTVHGAKGLEAEVVFLADTCRKADGRASGILHLDDGLNLPALPVWLLKGASGHPAIAEAKAALAKAEREESMRLLYVAMTRARDRLYVTGYQSGKKRPDGCWYDVAADAVMAGANEIADDAGRRVWQIGDTAREVLAASMAPDASAGAPEERAPAPALPGWARQNAPVEPGANARFAPSAAADHEADFAQGAARNPEESRLAGLLIHRLLQALPAAPAIERAALASAIAADYAHLLPASTRQQAAHEALSVIDHPDFRHLFAQAALTEAELAGELTVAGNGSLALGQVDRVIWLEGEYLVLDYKTGLYVPHTVEEAPLAHLAQVALYRHMLARILTDRPVRAALLYTRGPALLELPGHALDTVMADLRQERVAGS